MKPVLFILLFPFLFLVSGSAQANYSLGWDPNWQGQDFKQKTASLNAFIRALLQKVEGNSITLENLNMEQLFVELADKKIDAILTTEGFTQENLQKYDFSDPIISLAPVLIVPYNSSITSLKDLGGLVVAISFFDNSVEIVEKYPDVIIKEYENMPSALTDLAQGSIAAVVLDNLEAYPLVTNLYWRILKILPQKLNEDAIRLMTRKGENQELLDAVNASLDKMQADASYYRLRKKFDL